MTVVLEKDLNEEQAELVAAAISMITGVFHVTANEVNHKDAFAAEIRVKQNLYGRLLDLMKEDLWL